MAESTNLFLKERSIRSLVTQPDATQPNKTICEPRLKLGNDKAAAIESGLDYLPARRQPPIGV